MLRELEHQRLSEIFSAPEGLGWFRRTWDCPEEESVERPASGAPK
jgi:hypothetical protein